ncbi:dimethylsulfonioproprionate lyase family protein [Rhizobium sp. MC63]|uniref:Dimethylsulfonioproprionate lyase family protein n=1 Tax=Rhizobium mulingense TaxID=3031128 RepID=A0ACC6N2X9_9HYPH|nr:MULTISPECIES: dimethylsulfonioproprionate lyase family protein [unclassified Rhizobium]MDF0700693.1 dimethylsulfonioproprionate lyase family protein [Rhizobium sp. MC63]MEA3519949.1 dimethylsulfonioproprionate lyase family protein [Rhizobium sp. MJ31]
MARMVGRPTRPGADLLLNDDEKPAYIRLHDIGRERRPQPLQEFLNDIGGLMLSADAPAVASFVAGKVLQRLLKTGKVRPEGGPLPGMPEGLIDAVSHLAKSGRKYEAIANQFNSLAGRLLWRRGRTGPFASLNFGNTHSHAVLVGPGGMEERADLRVGVIYMDRYTRFPDHVQTQPRAFILLSPGEICLGDSQWFSAATGTVFANDAGQSFAIRCTAQPLLAVWCQVEPG